MSISDDQIDSKDSNQGDSNDSGISCWVWVGLVIYILFVLLYTLAFGNSDGKNVLLSSNELGDFLAGVFAPLAFLFLFLGYKQNSKALKIQSVELKQNTKALRLQVNEMKESVFQQSQLVAAATEDLTLSKQQIANNLYKETIRNQPFIHLNASAVKWIDDDELNSISADKLRNDAYFNNIKINISFGNSRAVAREVFVKISNKGLISLEIDNNIFTSGNEMQGQSLKFKYPEIFQGEKNYIFDVEFSYLDEIDQPQYQKFQIVVEQDEQLRVLPVKIIRGETSFTNQAKNSVEVL